MFRLGQSSFRRILLFRIVLLSIPVLLVGEYVTYQRARSGLMETAHLSLRESAREKAQFLQGQVKSLKSHLFLATQNHALHAIPSTTSATQTAFLERLAQSLPVEPTCLQIIDGATQQATAGTCETALSVAALNRVQAQLPSQSSAFDQSEIYVESRSAASGESPATPANSSLNPHYLHLEFLAPIPKIHPPIQATSSKLPSLLRAQVSLPLTLSEAPQSLTESVTVFEKGGKVLLNLAGEKKIFPAKAQTIQHPRLHSILTQIQTQSTPRTPIFLKGHRGEDFLASYQVFSNPTHFNSQQEWVILTGMSLERALSGLAAINSVLSYLNISLAITTLVLALWLARALASPLEKLRDYAHTVTNVSTPPPVPQDLRIREFNQLAESLNIMVEKLRSRAEALEFAIQETRAANQLKDEFLRTVSHELRTPLNGIINSLQFVIDELCDDPVEEQEYLHIANESALHLLSIVNDILDIARIQNGQLVPLLQPTGLNQVLSEAINLQLIEIQQKGLQLNLDFAPEPITVSGDPDKLRQVFLNVISNAIKFTKQGQITISTQVQSRTGLERDIFSDQTRGKVENSEDAISYAIVMVQDTGIGIAPEEQSRLFQPFAMADGSTTRESGGVGLGLAITRQLLNAMGSYITLQSPGKNQGTVVTIAVPLILQHNMEQSGVENGVEQNDFANALQSQGQFHGGSQAITQDPIDLSLVH
ncbi:MAG: sensor histidine kinase [Microcoleaceae cyanobacterium]